MCQRQREAVTGRNAGISLSPLPPSDRSYAPSHALLPSGTPSWRVELVVEISSMALTVYGVIVEDSTIVSYPGVTIKFGNKISPTKRLYCVRRPPAPGPSPPGSPPPAAAARVCVQPPCQPDSRIRPKPGENRPVESRFMRLAYEIAFASS